MARIRTIKPEFVESESMGRVSREARLLFIQLWTFVDDEGRARGSSRMLASRLFPYDNDAKDHIEGWLSELEREGCLIRYRVDGDVYLQIENWRKHQKIDKPSPSRIPAFDDASRIVAKPREPSTPDLVPSTVVPSTVVPSTKDSASQADKPPPQAPIDFKLGVFTVGLSYLVANGVDEKPARSALGMMRKAYGDVAVMNAIASAQGNSVSEPIAYLQRFLKANHDPRHGKTKTGPLSRIGERLAGIGPASQGSAAILEG